MFMYGLFLEATASSASYSHWNSHRYNVLHCGDSGQLCLTSWCTQGLLTGAAFAGRDSANVIASSFEEHGLAQWSAVVCAH